MMLERIPPIHPGEILHEEFLVPLALSQSRLAQGTGMPQSRVQAIVAGRRGITADTALRLAAFFGNSPQFWLNCQNTYELDNASYTGKLEKIQCAVQPYVRGAETAFSSSYSMGAH